MGNEKVTSGIKFFLFTAETKEGRFGYAHGIKPNNEIVVAITEPHFDHIGGKCLNGWFKTASRNKLDSRPSR
ncbi:MAG: hypothetical protein QNK40_00360 [Desulfobacterales bacterium]|nr:hypothetical protein [Desulfobacterales bacterium]